MLLTLQKNMEGKVTSQRNSVTLGSRPMNFIPPKPEEKGAPPAYLPVIPFSPPSTFSFHFPNNLDSSDFKWVVNYSARHELYFIENIVLQLEIWNDQ